MLHTFSPTFSTNVTSPSSLTGEAHKMMFPFPQQAMSVLLQHYELLKPGHEMHLGAYKWEIISARWHFAELYIYIYFYLWCFFWLDIWDNSAMLLYPEIIIFCWWTSSSSSVGCRLISRLLSRKGVEWRAPTLRPREIRRRFQTLLIFTRCAVLYHESVLWRWSLKV